MSQRTRIQSPQAAKAHHGERFTKEMQNHFASKRERKATLRKKYIAASKGAS